ncbi:hypothetical protein NDU88_004143 [Pleurodeles waltl]|uniref:Uncharacterized protein n=1 Tax=Pleurodeles waltl TaxID=8319 RepID=A0AAV7WV18_PLEWA|nr:hypothetical protein NDU88_004143 [Pleurodeles waltl]
MILSIQLSTAGHPRTPRQTAKSVVKGVLHTVITVAAGLIELMKTLPSTLKINMAPKAARYSGDKAEGSKTTRTGKDKGDSIGAVRCPIATAAKLSGKNTTIVVKDSKNDDGITPPMESDILDSGVVTKKKRDGSPIMDTQHNGLRSQPREEEQPVTWTIQPLQPLHWALRAGNTYHQNRWQEIRKLKTPGLG